MHEFSFFTLHLSFPHQIYRRGLRVIETDETCIVLFPPSE